MSKFEYKDTRLLKEKVVDFWNPSYFGEVEREV